MYESILSSIKTTEDLIALRDQVENTKASLYKNDSTNQIDEKLLSNLPFTLSEAISKDLKENNKDGSSLYDYLSGVLKAVENPKEVKMTVAFDPNRQFVDKIHNYLSSFIKGFFVVDIFYNPNIIGGAQISFDGKYSDNTLLSKIKAFKIDYTKSKRA